MKRRRYRRWWLYVLAGTLDFLLVVPAGAQSGVATEGAVFLLRPIGARAVGSGLAVVARHDGSETIWWNPAGLGALTSREVAIHHSQDFFATGDAITVILPSSLLGVIGVSADIEDFGEQENTTGPGVPSNGTILTRSFVLAASYGTPIGTHLRSGVSFKVVQLRLDCTGPCDLPTDVAQTYALDAGVQYDVGRSKSLTLGASVRNLGLPLQVEDSPQADPLPSRVQVGIDYRIPLPARYAKDAQVNVAVDVLDGVRVGNPIPRVGGVFAWQKRAFVRAGYVFEATASESGGPSLGLGFVSSKFSIDIARVFTGFSADAGQAPTFLSLRIEF
jgi:hypothetical protein